MGWTSIVKLHVKAPIAVAWKVRRRFTHKGFQNFTADTQGLIGMDAPGSHNRAHAEFEAHFLEQSDAEQVEELSRVAGQILSSGNVSEEITERVTMLAADSFGELVYTFSIWKDNVTEVADRVLKVLASALREELGSRWRVLDLPNTALFVHAYSQLGNGKMICFDLTPTLKLNRQVSFDLFFDGMYDNAEVVEPDTSRYDDFTAELMDAHIRCCPDVFNCYSGGEGAAVQIHGLQAKSELNGREGIILKPVDLESGRWAVKLSDQSVLVRTQNLQTLSR